MAEFFSKRDREKKKQQVRKDKQEKKLERKEKSRDGNSLSEMMAYVDENGNLTSIPQNPMKKREYSLDEIQISSPRAEDRNTVEAFEEGSVYYFNVEKGYGFIRDAKTKQSIFVHNTQFSEPINLNQRVRFLITKGLKGLEAIEVSVVK